jgi:zinc protease
VTAEDVQRVARKYLTPDRAHVIVVGDLTSVRPGIEALNLGPIEVLEVGRIAR